MSRKKVSRRKDKRIFAKTQKRTKAINVTPANMRGGIRL